MANEIAIRFSGTLENGSARDTFNIGGQKQIDQAAAGIDGGIVSVATSETTISFSRLTTAGLLLIQNLDETNYIEFGPDSTGLVKIGKLKPGEFAFLRLAASVTLKAIANTAACDVLVKCWED